MSADEKIIKNKVGLLKLSELIQHLVHSKPSVHAYDVETSTCHKITKGQAA